MGWTKNFGNPQGRLGKLILHSMNAGHGPISRWGLAQYDWKPDTVALDIGCGGGANVKRILDRCPQGKAAGIDISQESVRKSRQVNRDTLGKRCAIKLGSAEEIPYPEGKFDVVTAFETIYFWPDLPRAFQEVKRVLKPGGTFLVVCEMSDPDTVWTKVVRELTVYSPEALEGFFAEAGFQEIQVARTKKVWACVSGKKP